MKTMSKDMVLTLVFSVVSVLTLGLGLTWVNIERMNLAYELRSIQSEVENQEALIAKLNVERNTLLSPERLRAMAAEYGLASPRQGQIRRLNENGEEAASPAVKTLAEGPVKPAKKETPAQVKPAKKGKKLVKPKAGASNAAKGAT